jgi:hypothetical protein
MRFQSSDMDRGLLSTTETQTLALAGRVDRRCARAAPRRFREHLVRDGLVECQATGTGSHEIFLQRRQDDVYDSLLREPAEHGHGAIETTEFAKLVGWRTAQAETEILALFAAARHAASDLVALPSIGRGLGQRRQRVAKDVPEAERS